MMSRLKGGKINGCVNPVLTSLSFSKARWASEELGWTCTQHSSPWSPHSPQASPRAKWSQGMWLPDSATETITPGTGRRAEAQLACLLSSLLACSLPLREQGVFQDDKLQNVSRPGRDNSAEGTTNSIIKSVLLLVSCQPAEQPKRQKPKCFFVSSSSVWSSPWTQACLSDAVAFDRGAVFASSRDIWES